MSTLSPPPFFLILLNCPVASTNQSELSLSWTVIPIAVGYYRLKSLLTASIISVTHTVWVGLRSTWSSGTAPRLNTWIIRRLSLASLAFGAGCQQTSGEAISSSISMGLFHVAWAFSQPGSWRPSPVFEVTFSVLYLYGQTQRLARFQEGREIGSNSSGSVARSEAYGTQNIAMTAFWKWNLPWSSAHVLGLHSYLILLLPHFHTCLNLHYTINF